MKRLIDIDLQQWAAQRDKKPLIVQGPRHVGKTYSIRKMAKQYFEEVVEVNFEQVPVLANIFKRDFDPTRITEELAQALGTTITYGKTLIFFDEIHVVPAVLTALRYYYEMIPEQPIIASSSLLSLATQRVEMPIGRVSSLYMYPMTFIEFLVAIDEGELADIILNFEEVLPSILKKAHKMCLRYFVHYCAIGGMPKAIARWIETGDFNECAKVHREIIASYYNDVHAFAQPFQVKYIEALFDSIPHQLGQRFKYSRVRGSYRKRELAPCLDSLVSAEIVKKVYRDTKEGMPDIRHFKVLLTDIGLTQTLLGRRLDNHLEEPKNDPAIVEAAIGQELYGYSNPHLWLDLFYWHRAQRSSRAKVDYLVFEEGADIPIDVVTGKNITRRNMLTYLRDNVSVPYGIRFSENEYSKIGAIYNYPLYAVAASFENYKNRASNVIPKGES